MTDEEIDRMADNFVNAQDFTRVYSIARKAECGAFWKYGFLAGLKADRPKWHKVADGDLPTHSYRVLVYTDEGVGFGLYGLDDKKWHTYDTGFDVIAWKEIVLPELPKEN